MVRRCPPCSGVSRTASTSRRFSLSTTSAARDNSDAGHPGRDLAHGADRAGGDDHAHGRKRARRDRRADIGDGVVHRGERAHVLRLQVGLVDQRHFRRLAHDQMGLDLGLAQHFEKPHAVDRARSAGNADNQSCCQLSVMPPNPRYRALSRAAVVPRGGRRRSSRGSAGDGKVSSDHARQSNGKPHQGKVKQRDRVSGNSRPARFHRPRHWRARRPGPEPRCRAGRIWLNV